MTVKKYVFTYYFEGKKYLEYGYGKDESEAKRILESKGKLKRNCIGEFVCEIDEKDIK